VLKIYLGSRYCLFVCFLSLSLSLSLSLCFQLSLSWTKEEYVWVCLLYVRMNVWYSYIKTKIILSL
jgi:hypothetical protein